MGIIRKNRKQINSHKKKPGGQPGHKGNTLKQPFFPDHVEYHSPHNCSHCEQNLDSSKIISVEKRQVFDLPPSPKIEITEHQSFTIRCPSLWFKNIR